MLKTLTIEFPDAWDECIVYCLWAYRETPLDILGGVSPFQLVYRILPQGPLALLKNSWSVTTPSSVKKKTSEYIADLRAKIDKSTETALLHADKVKDKYKAKVDEKSKPRKYKPGQMVLLHIPVKGKPLTSSFFGPYKILERKSSVNYLIETPDRRKGKLLCHINLLRDYKHNTTSSVNVCELQFDGINTFMNASLDSSQFFIHNRNSRL